MANNGWLIVIVLGVESNWVIVQGNLAGDLKLLEDMVCVLWKKRDGRQTQTSILHTQRQERQSYMQIAI